ncbi:MAG: DUF3846 domain-containing protein [Bacteroidaceae bacterium]|nr:DUF3846 domain-containing protein [Bacteroidaceae bacterium]
MRMIKVIVKEPNEPVGHIEEVSVAFESLQKLVGGYIEAIPITKDISVLCNEDGRLLGLPANCFVRPNVQTVGTIVVIGKGDYNFESCPCTLGAWETYLKRINN